ncbi:MAG: transglycosylase SLT domain-containing protein [Deltaproteobacteria bacterium]|nr:transglycosylase SLT domain-containing protein [Deltaproteobacteria bacterium]
MPDRIRFTLVEDGMDIRSYDFDTETIQIGCDPSRGDNLMIELPQGKTHVRAMVIRSDDYVEFEVRGGPVFLQGSRLDEGDVAELNVGDMLIFGSKADGPKLRFEHAKEAELVLDDVADWGIKSGKKKKKRSQAAEDDLMFEEEVDKYAGKNVWQKYLIWYREQYAKFAGWRKKAARVKYWVGLVQMIGKKAQGFVGIGLALGAGAIGTYTQYTAKAQALMNADKAVEKAEVAVDGEKAAQEATKEIKEQMAQCGCEGAVGTSAAAIATADAVLDRFGAEKSLNVDRTTFWPNKQSVSYASILGGHYNAANKNRTTLPKTIDRVCSASGDKDRMNRAVNKALEYNLHEAYLFVPFVESYWCELAVSHTGPRGMMQFTRNTAKAAWNKVDSSQAEIPNYDWTMHRDWLIGLAKQRGYRGYYDLLANCKSTDRAAYKEHFYPGPGNDKYPKRLDPRDPRTDWESSTDAAVAWLASLHDTYKSRGFGEFDSILLAMSAYNQGEGEVNSWINLAKANYKRDNASALTFPEILGGAVKKLETTPDAEKQRQIKEGMRYAPSIIGAYLAAAPMLDERNCRN